MNVPIHDTLILLSEIAISDLITISIYLNNLSSWYFYIRDDIEFSILYFMIVYDSDKNVCLYVDTNT